MQDIEYNKVASALESAWAPIDLATVRLHMAFLSGRAATGAQLM